MLTIKIKKNDKKHPNKRARRGYIKGTRAELLRDIEVLIDTLDKLEEGAYLNEVLRRRQIRKFYDVTAYQYTQSHTNKGGTKE